VAVANEKPVSTASAFTPRWLPWLVAGGALLLYLLTLNSWVTFASLPAVAKVTGWDWWMPTLEKPLFLLLTWPVRWLPPGLQIGALNFFAALCAAGALGLLARSVALLPHDRTREQRARERSADSLLSFRHNWLPPLVAAGVCGLQLTFWENATAATGEALDILLFAYVIRCLLEFRLSGRESWLAKFALVYGLAAANNWAFIGFLPFFGLALTWIGGLGFFQPRVLGRVLAWGVAGLSLYLWLPLLATASPPADLSFWGALKAELALQRNVLLLFPKGRVLLLALTSLVPLLLLAVRWPSSFGETSVFGGWLAGVTFQLVHLLFFGVTLAVAFDPVFSPRALGYGLPFLTFYFVGALALGYFCGYLLLVFGRDTGKVWERPSALMRVVKGLVTVLVWLAAIGVIGGLAWKNFPVLRAAGSPALKHYAAQLAGSLPARGAFVISESPSPLLLVAAAEHGRPFPHLLVDARLLSQPAYHRRLQARAPGRWPGFRTTEVPREIDARTAGQLIGILAQTNAVYYLHPSFTQLHWEALYWRPRGLAYEVKNYPDAAITPPAWSPAEIAANQAFWAQAAENFPPVRSGMKVKNADALSLGALYATALDTWGVELQRAARLEEAGKIFDAARELNPENVAALLNRQANARLRRGEKFTTSAAADIEAKLGKYRSWGDVLSANGSLDDPDACQQAGQFFLQMNLLRQAAIHFLRVQALTPERLAPRLALADTFLRVAMVPEALKTLAAIRAQPEFHPFAPTNEIAVLRLEATAQLRATNAAVAEKLLLDAAKKFPALPEVYQSLAEIYFSSGRFADTCSALEKELRLAPDNVTALLNLGVANLQLRAWDRAVPPLDRVLKLQPGNISALANRGAARLYQGNLDAAARDYTELLRLYPGLPAAHFGLGEVAQRRNRMAEAIAHYETGLKFTGPDTADTRQASERLRQLKSGGK